IEVPAQPGSEALRVASFGTGMVFGEMAFLDGSARSGKATATSSCQLYLLQRNSFAAWASLHPHDAQLLLNAVAKQLSHRLRFTTAQLIAVSAQGAAGALPQPTGSRPSQAGATPQHKHPTMRPAAAVVQWIERAPPKR